MMKRVRIQSVEECAITCIAAAKLKGLIFEQLPLLFHHNVPIGKLGCDQQK